jgi:hypothetical protein
MDVRPGRTRLVRQLNAEETERCFTDVSYLRQRPSTCLVSTFTYPPFFKELNSEPRGIGTQFEMSLGQCSKFEKTHEFRHFAQISSQHPRRSTISVHGRTNACLTGWRFYGNQRMKVRSITVVMVEPKVAVSLTTLYQMLNTMDFRRRTELQIK